MDEKTVGDSNGRNVEAQVQQAELKDEVASLAEAHREYLWARHGTLELDPVPDMSDADPYNWSGAKKITNLLLVAFHAMMSTFTAAAIMSAFENISEDLNISLQQASYLTSLVIAVIGGGPLFWRPIADRFGRRPVFLVSLLCSAVGNIGCANSPSYTTMCLCRTITAFAICPALAIGSGVVTEVFFKDERARYLGIWTVFSTLGVPAAPFIFGFVALRVNYRWIYNILACINAVQFLLYFFFGPETLYLRKDSLSKHPAPPQRQNYLSFRRIDPTPLSVKDFYHPLLLCGRPRVLLPTVAYSMAFSFAIVMTTVMLPQLYVEKFHLNAQDIGLQSLALIIGSLLGEQLGGWFSDRWMALKARRLRRRYDKTVHVRPEWRLWLAYPGYALCVCGVWVFLVQYDRAGEGRWNVTPTIGTGIAAAGNQIYTTVLITYAVDCHREEAASIGVFITFARQFWGFIGPFWYPQMLENVGFTGSAGIITGLIVAVSVLPTILLQWQEAKKSI